MNRNQPDVIEYLMKEVRVLKEHLGPKRLRFTDDQRGRLARKAKKIGFGKLKEIAAIVTPQILLAWQSFAFDPHGRVRFRDDFSASDSASERVTNQ